MYVKQSVNIYVIFISSSNVIPLQRYKLYFADVEAPAIAFPKPF